MEIKVLGSGCANCRNTVALIEQVALAEKTAICLTKVEQMQDIVAYGVMSTPAVMIDGKVVHAGGVPSREKIEQWLTAATPSARADVAGGCGGVGAKPGCCR